MRYLHMALFMALLFTMTLSTAWADETAPMSPVGTTTPVENPAAASFKYEIPSITPDTQVFRRTPVIDGTIDGGEWDAFYTFSVQGWDATTYADWDENNLYAAVKSSRPINFIAVLDCDDDGWFHGDNNYEFRTSRTSEDSLNLAVSRYESRNTKMPIAVPVSPQEASMVDIKSSHSGDAYCIEMRIPIKLMQGFKMSSGKAIGLQLAVNASVDETGWVPNNELGDTKDCTLVTKKFASLKPIELGFDLRDCVIARGDDLVGRFHLTNSGSETADIKSYTIAGEGKAGEYLSSERVRLEGVTPGQHVAKDYRTELLSNMNVGSWALGAEVRSESGRLGSMLVSFDVVEPYDLELKLPDRDVKANVKDVTVAVVVNNNRRVGISGVAKIVFPTGWEIWRNLNQREFRVSARSSSAVSFKAKPPLGAIGDIPVKIEVTCNGETKTVEGSFRVVNP